MQKKNIGIITILDVTNFGSMLQGYALAETVEGLGYNVIFINYWRPLYSTKYKVRTFLHDKSLGNIAKRCAFAFTALTFYEGLRIRIRKILKRRFRFTKKYMSNDEIKNSHLSIDAVISGSDQIWNTTYNGGIDLAFYLDFTDKPKIAYAASSGLEKFEDNDLPEITHLLNKYSAISLRESHTTEYFKSLGFSKAVNVLDPSLLLTADEWNTKLNIPASDPNDKYLLVYSVERFNNNFIFSQAKRIAEDLGLKVYVVCATFPVEVKKYNFDKIYSLATVKTFLKLLRGASFVVASSFHGTAFSINYNKPFISISPNKFNIRMESIMKLTQLENRIVRNEMISVKELQPIDWGKVNAILKEERGKSISFLQTALAEAVDKGHN